jgi:hypothetical protein
VSDIAISCGFEPKNSESRIAGVFRVRDHELRAEISGAKITLKMGPLGAVGNDGVAASPTSWTTLDEKTLPAPLAAGRVVNIELWHVDQSLQVWIDGARVAEGAYEWSPAERLRWSTGMTLEEVVKNDSDASGRHVRNSLSNARAYRAPQVRWELTGPAVMHRVRLQRDLYYQSSATVGLQPVAPRATHPLNPITLGPDHFFTCGDNSPCSLDARLWPAPDAWTAAIDPTEGVVHRELMIGRAFFVYFPSFVRSEHSVISVPDAGRLRWIW